MFLKEEEKSAGEPAKVGTLKLSEAMRIGASMKPQIFTGFRRDGCSCALGAAADGFAIPLGGEWTDKFEEMVPLSILGQIIHRNDRLRQTREQIADWLESQGY